MKKIQRWWQTSGQMGEAKVGDWVKWEDHCARVAELEAALRQINHLAKHAPGAGQASTLQLIETLTDKALNG